MACALILPDGGGKGRAEAPRIAMRTYTFIGSFCFLILLIAGFAHTESWISRVSSGREEEISFVHQQVADVSWILLLCVFSLLVRFRRRRGARAFLLAAVFLLFALAALQSHPVWKEKRVLAADDWSLAGKLTRIATFPAAISETGLQLDDVVSAMAFDPDGNLWLSTPSNGPYCYQVHSNELENLLRPDAVYGLSPDPDGMWVMTSQGAHLYHGVSVVREVGFPEGVIPLTALASGGTHLFGTTHGLFIAKQGEARARSAMSGDRITLLHRIPGGVIVAGDSGIWRWTPRGIASCLQMRHLSLAGMVSAGGRVLAPTGESGILNLSPRPLENVRFGIPELNMLSQGAAVVHRGIPCFGSYPGAIVYQNKNRWLQAKIGDYPVTALASDGATLYAWCGGRLLAVSLS